MPNVQQMTDLWQHASEVLKIPEREADLLNSNPEILMPFAGEWVAVQDGQVIAHSIDGAKLAKIVNLRDFPQVYVGYVPTEEQRRGIFILRQSVADIERG